MVTLKLGLGDARPQQTDTLVRDVFVVIHNIMGYLGKEGDCEETDTGMKVSVHQM